MDMRTGRTYATKEDALAAGVPESDIAEVTMPTDVQSGDLQALTVPGVVQFASGPFKDRLYQRNERGQLVRIKE